jgi:hypothetical protein
MIHSTPLPLQAPRPAQKPPKLTFHNLSQKATNEDKGKASGVLLCLLLAARFHHGKAQRTTNNTAVCKLVSIAKVVASGSSLLLVVNFRVLNTTRMKTTVFSYVQPCSTAETGRRFRGAYCLHNQGVEQFLPDYTAQHPEYMALFHRYHLNFFILGYFHCLDNLQ